MNSLGEVLVRAYSEFNQQNHRYETSFHRPRRSLLRLAVPRHSRVKREYEEGWVGSASVYRKQARAKEGTLIFDEYFFTVKSVQNHDIKNIHSTVMMVMMAGYGRTCTYEYGIPVISKLRYILAVRPVRIIGRHTTVHSYWQYSYLYLLVRYTCTVLSTGTEY